MQRFCRKYTEGCESLRSHPVAAVIPHSCSGANKSLVYRERIMHCDREAMLEQAKHPRHKCKCSHALPELSHAAKQFAVTPRKTCKERETSTCPSEGDIILGRLQERHRICLPTASRMHRVEACQSSNHAEFLQQAHMSCVHGLHKKSLECKPSCLEDLHPLSQAPRATGSNNV